MNLSYTADAVTKELKHHLYNKTSHSIETIMSGVNNAVFDPGTLAIELQQIFTKIYSNAMDSIKPNDTTDLDYNQKLEAWDDAFQFTKQLQNYINDLSAMISTAGQTNTSGNITVRQDFVIQLQNVLASDDFKQNMNIAKPDTVDPQLLKTWYNAFTFPDMLQTFANSVKGILAASGNTMPFFTFLSMLNAFLNGVQANLGLS